MTKLNLKPDQLDQLQNMPFEKLEEAIKGPGMNFGPVVDGKSLPHDPFDPTAPEESATVPLLIGTVWKRKSTFFRHAARSDRRRQSAYARETDDANR